MPATYVEATKKMVALGKKYKVPTPAVRKIWDAALDTGMPWVCPICEDIIYVGYQEVCEIGNPICSNCGGGETEMIISDAI